MITDGPSYMGHAHSAAPKSSCSTNGTGLLALLSLGEMTALVALADGPAGPSKGVVLFAVGYGLFWLLFEPLLQLTYYTAPRLGKVAVPVVILATLALGVSIGAAALAWMALAIFVGLLIVQTAIRLSEIPQEIRDEAVPQRPATTKAEQEEPDATGRS